MVFTAKQCRRWWTAARILEYQEVWKTNYDDMEEKVIVRINESVTSVTRKDLDIRYVY